MRQGDAPGTDGGGAAGGVAGSARVASVEQTPSAEPDAADVRAALSRVLGSPAFQQSPQLRRFLAFVVEETLAGRAAGLKGYTIGTLALGRGTDFNPQADPIVRVEARRLRQALDEYYAGPGRDDRLRIVLPRGGYVPDFVVAAAVTAATPDRVLAADAPPEQPSVPSAAAPADAAPPAPPSLPVLPGRDVPAARVLAGPLAAVAGRPKLAAWAATAAGAVLCAIVLWLVLPSPPRGSSAPGEVVRWTDPAAGTVTTTAAPRPTAASGTTAASGPGSNSGAAGSAWRSDVARHRVPLLRLAPFSVQDGAVPDGAALLLAARLRAALGRFDEIDVAAVPRLAMDLARLSGVTSREAVAGADLRGPDAVPDYILVGRILRGPEGRPRLETEALHRQTGRVAGAFVVDAPPGAPADEPFGEGAVHYLSSALAQPFGVVLRYERGLMRDAQPPSGADGSAWACLVRATDYWRSYEAREVPSVLKCLERAVGEDPGFAVAWAHLAFLRLEQYRLLPDRDQARAALDGAYQAARRAVQENPFGARTNQALADVLFVRGELDEAHATGERALALNPYDPDIAADLGARYLALGELARGEELLKEAVRYTPGRPPWYDFFLFLAAMLRGDAAAMAERAGQFTSDDYALGLVAQVIVAHRQGNPDTARRLAARLASQDPAWASDPARALARYRFAPELRDRLAAAYRSAIAG